MLKIEDANDATDRLIAEGLAKRTGGELKVLRYTREEKDAARPSRDLGGLQGGSFPDQPPGGPGLLLPLQGAQWNGDRPRRGRQPGARDLRRLSRLFEPPAA